MREERGRKFFFAASPPKKVLNSEEVLRMQHDSTLET
jgi:hypothetical protein